MIHRLEWTEGEVRQLTRDIASLLQVNRQQHQQLQQQQQELTTLSQLLVRLTSSAEPSVESVPTVSAMGADSSPLFRSADSSSGGFSEPKVGSPERFDRDPAQVRAFVTNCQIVFSLQPRNFATEAAKVAYTVNHLSGRARLCGMAVF